MDRIYNCLKRDGIMFSPLDRKTRGVVLKTAKLNGKPQHIPFNKAFLTLFAKLGLLESHTGKVKTQLEWYSRDTLLLTHMPADLLARKDFQMYGEKHENDFRQFDVFPEGSQDKMTPNQLHYNALEHDTLSSYRSANKVFPEASFKNIAGDNLTATARAVAPSVLCVPYL
ncbi:hypothetical protein SPFM20_00267 [Salmonella phage SPFM20]|nr:hypothetical protein SPFM8_00266 [Salmonella phage SPFM8]VFR14945.1 hypothetical protein SPFM20_00267 [Salmonella phage SPFM20]